MTDDERADDIYRFRVWSGALIGQCNNIVLFQLFLRMTDERQNDRKIKCTMH